MPPPTPALQAQSLTKHYAGNRGLTDLTLAVAPGEVFGYLGPNGAGKTTTIRLMLGFARPTRGHLTVLGAVPGTRAARRARAHVGYLPGDLGLPDAMTANRALKFYERLSGRPATLRPWLAEALQLQPSDLARELKVLSKGTRQKVGIIQAMQHDPQLLILDEPTTGLDPVVQARFFEVLREFRRRGRTVFFSTHVLSEATALCDRVGVLREGRLIENAPLSHLIDRAERRLYIKLREPSHPTPATTSPVPGQHYPRETDTFPVIAHARPLGREPGGWITYVVDPARASAIPQALLDLDPADWRFESAIEPTFLKLYGIGHPPPAAKTPTPRATSPATPPSASATPPGSASSSRHFVISTLRPATTPDPPSATSAGGQQ